MARPARLHRLPQRLDYTLIPAPLDLSLPDMAEKSPLPAVIVTPSSPIHTQDFAIAFLAPPPKPSIRERVTKSFNNITENSPIIQSRPFRTFLILALFFFIMMMSHLLAHRLAMRPYRRFESDLWHRHQPVSDSVPRANQGDIAYVPNPAWKPGLWDWIGFELKQAWTVVGGVAVDDRVAFENIVSQSTPLSDVE